MATSSAHRGEHDISRKATAQGMSDALRCPVCSCAAFLALFAHETAGAARIRHSLRPLNFGGREVSCKPRAQCVARIAKLYPASSPGLTGTHTPRRHDGTRTRGVWIALLAGDDNWCGRMRSRPLAGDDSGCQSIATHRSAPPFSVVSLSIRIRRRVRPVQQARISLARFLVVLQAYPTPAAGTARPRKAPRNAECVRCTDHRFYRTFSYSPYAFPLCQNWLRTLRMSDA